MTGKERERSALSSLSMILTNMCKPFPPSLSALEPYESIQEVEVRISYISRCNEVISFISEEAQ